MKPYPNFQDVERLSGATWHELVELDSRLAELLWEARRSCGNCRRWSDVEQVFAPIRNRLVELVGFARNDRRHPVLGRPEAYQVAYWKLYDAVAVLLPTRTDCADETLEEQTGEIVVETCDAESAPTAPARARLPSHLLPHNH